MCLFICYSLYFDFHLCHGGEQFYTNYIHAYAVNTGAHFAESAAANLGFVFYVCYLFGRFLWIFPTRVMHLDHCLSIVLWQCHNLWNRNAVRVYNHSLALWLVTGFEGNIYVYVIHINDVYILYHGLIFILAWISNHMFCKVWNEITYQFTNPKGSDVEVWEWINNSISHSTMSVITFPGYHEC